jgi:hypothetical protein
MRFGLAFAIALAVFGLSRPDATTLRCWSSGGSGARDTFTIEELGPAAANVSARAVRHLQAASEGGTSGWMIARTDYDPEIGVQYRIISEGGSERIRNRVLRRVLDTEVAWSSRAERSKSELTS